ncbi:hypothetical protein L596_018355 [Steinernema carpocapsae]|uniref:G-protein coupled receptors family 3 profile domain-containing protein n=1 Tax=Steinernema carpocapsae TaxID=34508 RepID=A0A4V6XW44_STECR|nr:hypothetical protein L596_018355 [Steinernema carpocapsae]
MRSSQLISVGAMWLTSFLLLCIPLVESLDFRTRNVRPDHFRNVPGVVPPQVYSNPYQQFASQQQQPMANNYLPVYQPDSTDIPTSQGFQGGLVDVPLYTNPPTLQRTPEVTRKTSPFPSKATTLGTVKITRQMTQKKSVARLSKMSPKLQANLTSEGKRGSARISVPSHRLLNDILVIPSERRMYILAIMPIHESAKSQGFECGNLDVNAFLRLSAFLKALEEANASPNLREANLHIGAVIVNSCSSDLRAVADLYELLSGTNIEKTDIIAIVRDDSSFLPNVDEFTRHLRIPTVNTFFASKPQVLTTGTLPSEESPLQAILDLILHTKSTCVSVIYDDLHAEMMGILSKLTEERGMCIDQKLGIRGPPSTEAQQNVVRKLVLSEARIVIVLYGDKSWIDLLSALNIEMVIPGRFVFATIQNDLWMTSRQYLESWPHFDQLLLSAESFKSSNMSYLGELTSKFSKYPYPQTWFRQFWSTAFHCHIDGETMPGEQFSRPCPHKQSLNFSFVAPDLDITPISLAVHTVSHSIRKLVDNVCPGALVHTLTDCLNDPYRSLFASLVTVQFAHPLLGDRSFAINASTGFADAPIKLNRVVIERGLLRFDEIARWSHISGLLYTAENDLYIEDRDGKRLRLQSACPKSACSSESAIKSKIGLQPTFKSGLHDMPSLVFSAVATLLTFVYLMCMYQQLVGAKHDPYRICTMIMFSGLAFMSMISIFFIMQPSWITCAIRRNCLSVAVSLVFSPILVKTIAIWHHEVLHSSKLSSTGSPSVSPFTLFWASLGIVFIQIVIVAEWSVFEDPTYLEFTSFGDDYSWRCSPGNRFEQKLFFSMILNVISIVISLVCSIISVRNPHSRQNIVSCTVVIVVGVALYVSLPLIPFRTRDQVFAGVLLTYTIIALIITYCRRGFVYVSPSVVSGKENLVAENHTDSDKMSQFGPDRSQIWQNQYPSATLPGLHRQPSTADYTISSHRILPINYLAATGTFGHQSEYRPPNTRQI